MASGGKTLLALATGVGLGFGAGVYVALGHEESLVAAKRLLARLRAQIDGSVAAAAPPAAGACANGVGSAHRASSTADVLCSSSARPSTCSDGGDSVDGAGLSPSSSLAGSMGGFVAQPTPLGSGGAARASSGGDNKPADKLKMVVVVRDDIAARWGPGKLSVMVSSCFMGLYKRCYKNRQLRGSLLSWEAQKGAKLVLRCPDEGGLTHILEAAREAGMPAHCLLEAVPAAAPGEAPSRARAILALGPATQAALAAAGCQSLATL